MVYILKDNVTGDKWYFNKITDILNFLNTKYPENKKIIKEGNRINYIRYALKEFGEVDIIYEPETQRYMFNIKKLYDYDYYVYDKSTGNLSGYSSLEKLHKFISQFDDINISKSELKRRFKLRNRIDLVFNEDLDDYRFIVVKPDEVFYNAILLKDKLIYIFRELNFINRNSGLHRIILLDYKENEIDILVKTKRFYFEQEYAFRKKIEGKTFEGNFYLTSINLQDNENQLFMTIKYKVNE